MSKNKLGEWQKYKEKKRCLIQKNNNSKGAPKHKKDINEWMNE